MLMKYVRVLCMHISFFRVGVFIRSFLRDGIFYALPLQKVFLPLSGGQIRFLLMGKN